MKKRIMGKSKQGSGEKVYFRQVVWEDLFEERIFELRSE